MNMPELLSQEEINRIAGNGTPHWELFFRNLVIDLPWTKNYLIRIDPLGDASYHSCTERLVVIGLLGVVEGYLCETEAELYQAVYYVIAHEVAHIRYTQNEAYEYGLRKGVDTILQTVAKAVGEENVRFRKDADWFMFGLKLYQNYNLNLNMNFLTNIAAEFMNILCDGRINRITASKSPKFDERRLYCFNKAWLYNEVTAEMYPDPEENPFTRIHLFTNETLSVAKWHRPLRGFRKTFGGTDIGDQIDGLNGYAYRAVVSRSTREMVQRSFFCYCEKLLAPMILECLFFEREQRQEMTEAMKNLIEEQLRNGQSPDAPEWMIDLLGALQKLSGGEKVTKTMGSPKAEEDPTESAQSFLMALPEAELKRLQETEGEQEGEGLSAEPESEPGTEAEKEGQIPSDQKGQNQKNKASKKTREDLRELSSEEEEEALEAIRKEMEEAAKKLRSETELIVSSVNAAAAKAAREFGEEVKSPKIPVSKETVGKATKLPFMEVFREYELTERLPEDLYQEGMTRRRELLKMAAQTQKGVSRHMKEGKIDTQNIWRFAAKRLDGFRRESVTTEMEGCVYILLDNSGSMSGEKKTAACRELSVQEVEFSGLMPLKIVAFDYSGSMITHEVIKDWDERSRNNCSWNFLLHGRDGGGNADEHDIRVATAELLRRKETRRLLIVLSDGTPDDPADCKKAITEARNNKGVSVFGIYFEEGDVDSNCADQFKEMYEKDYVCCSMNEIGRHLGALLKKFFKFSLKMK